MRYISILRPETSTAYNDIGLIIKRHKSKNNGIIESNLLNISHIRPQLPNIGLKTPKSNYPFFNSCQFGVSSMKHLGISETDFVCVISRCYDLKHLSLPAYRLADGTDSTSKKFPRGNTKFVKEKNRLIIN